MSYDLLGGDPYERTQEDIALQEYIDEYGLSMGLALYKEDYDLPLDAEDIRQLELAAALDDDPPETDFQDYGEQTLDGDGDLADDPEISDEIPDEIYPELDLDDGGYSAFDRDDALDFSPGYDYSEGFGFEYEIHLQDGEVRHGYMWIYHEDTDLDSAALAHESDIDSGDVVYINYL
jgi:hypothetical protein